MRYWYGKRDHVTIPSTPSDKGSAWRAAETSSSSTATTNGQRDPNCRNCRARHLDALRSCPDPPVMNMQWDCSTAPLPFVGISCGGLQRGAGSRLGMPISMQSTAALTLSQTRARRRKKNYSSRRKKIMLFSRATLGTGQGKAQCRAKNEFYNPVSCEKRTTRAHWHYYYTVRKRISQRNSLARNPMPIIRPAGCASA